MAIYTFVNGQRKRAFTYNPRVIVGGAVKKVIEGYTFINGQRHKLFGKWSFDHTEVYLEHSLESLPFGTYRIACRGAGGAGGENGKRASSTVDFAAGGAGAKGELVAEDITFTESTTVNIHIGTGGEVGKGGKGGSAGYQQGAEGGAGGGAGAPSVVIWETNQELHNVHANGGGGGGGGGGSTFTFNTRSAYGCGGGGGGEYLRFDTVVDIDTYRVAVILGKKGGSAGGYDSGGQAGVEGNTTDFPDIYSGRGGNGGDWEGGYSYGGAGASGGGASGGGGASNGKPQNGSYGGPGGGGAGGSMDAGGGAAGNGRDGYGRTDGYNHHTIPTDTTAENSLYGVDANYGIGGTTNQNGSQGFVVIRRIG